MTESSLFRLEFYVPASHLETVKAAMFAAGAGKVGNYDCCAWQTQGQGQYRPLPESNPFSGELDKLQIANEFKVEMVCEKQFIAAATQALKQNHPYEEVAYAVLALQAVEP